MLSACRKIKTVTYTIKSIRRFGFYPAKQRCGDFNEVKHFVVSLIFPDELRYSSFKWSRVSPSKFLLAHSCSSCLIHPYKTPAAEETIGFYGHNVTALRFRKIKEQILSPYAK
jgi:hypothetical protein